MEDLYVIGGRPWWIGEGRDKFAEGRDKLAEGRDELAEGRDT